MRAPVWLDELALHAGPPWLSMGTHAVGDSAWLLPDDACEHDLAEKARLRAERPSEVFAALDTPQVQAASAEVLSLVRDATGARPDPSAHPLDAAGRLVQEDLCVLVLRDGAPHLDAASVCFPSYWRLAEKLGQPLVAVHDPVAHYPAELAAQVDAFIGRLRPERPVWRRNWSIHDDPAFFLPAARLGASPVGPRTPMPPTPAAGDVGGKSSRSEITHAPNLLEGSARPPDGLWLRSERQTVHRLLSADAVLFTIRTQQVPLAALDERPDVARRMAAAIAAWSPEMWSYKGRHGARRARAWLASR